MGLAGSLQFPLATATGNPAIKFPQLTITTSISLFRMKSHSSSSSSQPALYLSHTDIKRCRVAVRSTKSDSTSDKGTETKTTTSETPSRSSSTRAAVEEERDDDGLSKLGKEIKKVMKERGDDGDANEFLGGVVEEVKKIEWPAFGKVLGTTGVVLGVIAGSSVVLLTLNAVLSELSDKVFAGKGVQDFFG
ncbi:hypothetical protein Dimus_008863 [Dionaea muscipula]